MLTVFAEGEGRFCNCEHTPMIYVFGRQEIYDDPHSPSRRALTGYDLAWTAETMYADFEAHKQEMMLGNFDGFCDDLVAQFTDRYRGLPCDENGDLPNNSSGVDWSWSEEWMRDEHWNDNVYSYVFVYDPRKDPFEVADEMNAYIEAVRRVTGHRRVAILSRCMGTEMAIAYFQKYGWQDIDTFFAYSSAALGTTIFSELFAGKFTVDLDSISNFLSEQHAAYPEAPETELLQLLRTLLEVLHQMHVLGLPSAYGTLLMERIRTNALPRILKASFATSPGYWSMVSSEDYAQAKNFLFKNDAGTYARLIERIDAYDNLVRRPMKSILTRMQADGVKLCILAKYGFQLIPYTQSRRAQSDDKITLEAQSFGATSANFGQTLRSTYISLQEARRLGRYISPDKIIDASTAWFPDVTWFVKNLRHNDFPYDFHQLVLRMIRSDRQLTVNDDPAFPQFLTYRWQDNAEHWEPMAEENMHTEFVHPDFETAWQALKDALRAWLLRPRFQR